MHLTIPKLLFTIALALYLTAQPAVAQTVPFGLTVSPPTSLLRIQAGKTVVHSVSLENSGAAAVEVTPTLRAFASDNISGNPRIIDAPITTAYLTLQNSDLTWDQPFVLQPGEKQQFVLEFAVPDNTPTQETHLILLFSTAHKSALSVTNSSAAISGEIGSTLIVSIVEDELPAPAFSITAVKIPRIVDSFATLSPQITVKNSSTVTHPVEGTISLYAFGKEISSAKIYPTAVLPDATRQLTLRMHPTDPNLSPIPMTLRPRFMMGPVTMKITLAQGDSQLATAEHTVIALPIVIAIIAAVGIAVSLAYYHPPRFLIDKRLRRPYSKK